MRVETRGRMCVHCVMDESASDLAFDEAGVCRYCREAAVFLQQKDQAPDALAVAADELVTRIKREGRFRRYDCVMGLSGGADSSYALYLARRLGLRPLAVHVDNGWNTELAVMNIERMVRALDVDLITIVIDWNQFRELQLAFLRAGVVDLELPSDHAIIAGIYRVASRFLLRWILSGNNSATEVGLPQGWNHRKTDLTNLRAIHRKFSHESLSTFPMLSTVELALRHRIGQQLTPFLSLFPYVKAKAIETLQTELGWRPYDGKHGESIITRFYQGYILPRKFGFDKRRIHLSRLVAMGQITREEALEELEKPPYDPEKMAVDREFVIKKFGITEDEFERIMSAPPVSHLAYASDERLLQTLFAVNRGVKKVVEVLRGRR